MSKRAEEAQASAILPESIISYAKEHAVLSGLVYREGVKFGYEQAEKDTIERVVKWLEENNIGYNYSESSFDCGNPAELINDLKKAMED